MRKNNLVSTEGLSMSKAQSISNLCNQRALEITSLLSGINNSEKTIKINGTDYVTVSGKKLPSNVVELLKERAELYATQAFLMENIKAKENLLKFARNEESDTNDLQYPDRPEQIYPSIIGTVEDDFGWEQLTTAEINEFYQAEAYASHIGQFIHHNSPLDKLRRELPEIPSIEWMVVKDGEKTPVKIKVHHNSEELLKLHEELANLHRIYEMKVNYIKSKVKNLTTEENARIAKINADAQNAATEKNNELYAAYEIEYNKINGLINNRRSEFEKIRQENIKNIVSLKINVDPKFQKVIDIFSPKVETKTE